jgi:hypothetical protein
MYGAGNASSGAPQRTKPSRNSLATPLKRKHGKKLPPQLNFFSVLLVRCRESPVAPGARIWVVFPYDAAATGAFEPETPARLVRAERDADGGCRVAFRLRLHGPNGSFPASSERRAVPRVSVSLPIFVRTDSIPWPEEAMTRDFSGFGVQFETPHVYNVGETVHAKIPWAEWARMGEVQGRVVRAEAGTRAAAPDDERCDAGAAFNCVAVQLADHG